MISPFRNNIPSLLLVASAALFSLAQSPAATGSTLLQFDFNGVNPWPQAQPRISAGAVASVEARNIGTIDVAGSKDVSGGILLAVDRPAAQGEWTAALDSGPLAVRNAETNPGKLTLSFSLSVSAAHPVKVRVESFDAQRQRTGGLETTIYPAAPDFYQRYALDLSTLKPVGSGAFDPTAPFAAFTFELSSAAGWSGTAHHELRLDNVHYAAPAFYVSPGGSDTSDGRTEKTAFATPRKAVEMAQPGDIILLMEGTYPSGQSTVSFRRGGTPSAWITLKNYPGHKPLLLNETWNCIVVKVELSILAFGFGVSTHD